MTETLLNRISKHPNNKIVTSAWLTGQTGEIVDLLGNCVFRFIDYIDSPELRLKHTTEESKLACPVIACGLVGYWLHKKDTEGTKAIFEGYYDLRLKEYEKAHENDDDAWERDFKKEFVCRYHIPHEKKQIKTSEALFAYITESDQKKIISITNNYLKFARAKRKELYPPKHPANRIIEDTFLDAYRVGGPAYECMRWMRTEYNLPYMGPHWYEGSKTEIEQLVGKWKERHERVIPGYVAEEYEDFDDSVLKYTNGGLMDEIDNNIKKCQTREDRIRYIISLLQPFKEFAEAFDAKARIDERKRSIEEHKKWIKDWETMTDDAIDERTGEPIRPKDQISACKEAIEEYNLDIKYWEKVQADFYWFAQHGLGAGHYREYPQEVNDDMCKYLGRWWECMIFFARRLASLALTYGIKLMDVQERCEVYLTWSFRLHDYVDNKFITSTEHARRLLDEIEAKKPKSKTLKETGPSANEESKESETTKDIAAKEEAIHINVSDFENLKDRKDNQDLDYYLSEEHWNYHVNHLLYIYLKNRYKGNEVGIYINLVLLNGSKSFKIDYNQIYGVMFNEAYSFCSFVLNTKVPETKIHMLEKSAAELCNIEPAAPIISYHILVMTGLILSFSDVKNEAVGRFLNCLSNHNNTHFFGEEFHHFEDYIKIGLDIVAAIMIDSRLQPGKLRLGYDYKDRDNYLRKTIPWYRICAEKYEKRIQESKDKSVQPTDVMNVHYGTENNMVVANALLEEPKHKSITPEREVLMWTDRAKLCFQKAVTRKWMIFEDGKYSWCGVKPRPSGKPSKSELAYFLGKVYGFEYKDGNNCGTKLPANELNKYFGFNKSVTDTLLQVYRRNNEQPYRSIIDDFFNEIV